MGGWWLDTLAAGQAVKGTVHGLYCAFYGDFKTHGHICINNIISIVKKEGTAEKWRQNTIHYKNI